MKKILLLTAALILGTIATMAQTNALSFTIYPDESGPYVIWYSTKDAPSTHAMEVDWGDGAGVQVYNDNVPTGSDPTKAIQGTVFRANPIKIYSNCIEAIYIVTEARGIRCEANNPKLEYIYYFNNNLSSENLEALYLSLPDRIGDGWGELHLSQQENIADAGDNILKSNAFITHNNNWRVCSYKAWYGELYERMHWNLTNALATTYLIPAITLQTKSTANMTDLQIGIMDSFDWPWNGNSSMVRIDDGTDNYKSLEVLSYETNNKFEYYAPKLVINGTGATGEVKIYGALVSHFKTNQIRSLNLNNITNLRYIYSAASDSLTNVLGIHKQKQLNFLNLTDNASLTGLDLSALTKLEYLDVCGCSNLEDLYFSRVSLESLLFNQCVKLKPNRISTLSDATELLDVVAGNLGWDACELDALYYDLRPVNLYLCFIYVDLDDLAEPSNDWEGSNKEIATDKGWIVKRFESGSQVSIYGDGGGCITGISQEEAAQFISVFPNPATDVVNITLVPNLNAESLQVIDVTGKTVFSIPVSPSESEYQINVSDYAKGIYLIRVGHITHKMLVK